MKVLQINAVYGISSTGRTVAELDEYLKKTGIESIVATTQTTINRDDIYIIGTKLERKIHAFFSRLTGKQAYFSFFATKRLLRWVKKEQPDIIHLRNLHANYIHLGLLLKYIKKHNIATVITLHDCWIFTGKCTHYTEQACYKWETGCHSCPQLKKDNKSWFFDSTKKLWEDKKEWLQAIPSLAVIGVSDWITNEGKKSFLNNASIFKRIYNWIDLKVFYPREESLLEKYNLSKDKFLILCIGAVWTIESLKYKDLLELSKRLDNDTRIVLAGKLSKDMILPENVISIGYISDTAELAKLYSSVDVYVHLSREDTFGKVIAEALACGTPAIVYNATACPELIGENCGYVVEKGNVLGIVDAIKHIKENGKGYYSSFCVNFAKYNFEKDTLIEEMKAIYCKLLEGDKK